MEEEKKSLNDFSIGSYPFWTDTLKFESQSKHKRSSDIMFNAALGQPSYYFKHCVGKKVDYSTIILWEHNTWIVFK